MKHYMSLCILISSLYAPHSLEAQGTFVNLNFESANVVGFPPDSSDVPTSDALPGWTALYGSTATSEVWYDGISLGGAMVSVIDANAPAFAPLQGTYSAFLFGGAAPPPGSSGFVSAGLSQTAVVPAGTQSLQFDGYVSGAPFVVTLGGQTINMTALETFPNTGSYPPYTLYGGNIPSAFAGQTETLSFTEPPATGVQPSMFELDNISFSTQSIPEPSPPKQT
jgi:hypothetical protein